jgi:hypothetical protein
VSRARLPRRGTEAYIREVEQPKVAQVTCDGCAVKRNCARTGDGRYICAACDIRGSIAIGGRSEGTADPAVLERTKRWLKREII